MHFSFPSSNVRKRPVEAESELAKLTQNMARYSPTDDIVDSVPSTPRACSTHLVMLKAIRTRKTTCVCSMRVFSAMRLVFSDWFVIFVKCIFYSSITSTKSGCTSAVMAISLSRTTSWRLLWSFLYV